MGIFDELKRKFCGASAPVVEKASRPEYFPDDAMLKLERREIQIAGPIDDECANTTIAQLLFLQMKDPAAPITLLIESSGGAITACLAIFDTIRFVKPPVHTRTETGVQGAALWLLAAGTKGQRLVGPDSLISIQPTGVVGNEPNLELIRKLNHSLAENLAERSELSKAEVLSALQSDGRHFTVQEAIAAGLADGLLPEEEGAAPWTLF